MRTLSDGRVVSEETGKLDMGILVYWLKFFSLDISRNIMVSMYILIFYITFYSFDIEVTNYDI